MAKVAIVTDSTAYIPGDMVKEYNLTIAPQVLIWGEQTLKDGVDIQPAEFYTRLSKATVMPSTSQVTIPDFTKIFGNLKEQGYDILAILISNALSGTIDSAIHAKAANPDATIEIVDSNTTAMALGFAVLTVARAAETGQAWRNAKPWQKKPASMSAWSLPWIR